MMEPIAATIRCVADDRAEVRFNEPQFGISSGQACVFYQGELVLGGGWIVKEKLQLAA